MSSDRGTTRRRVLSAVGVGTTATLAGCTGLTATASEGKEGTGDLSLLMMSAPNGAVIGKPHTVAAKIRNAGRRATDLRTAFERRAPGQEWTSLASVERTVPAGDTVTVAREVVFDEQLTTWQYRLEGFDATVAVESRLDCGCKREGQPLLDDDTDDTEETTDGDGSDEDEDESGTERLSGGEPVSTSRGTVGAATSSRGVSR